MYNIIPVCLNFRAKPNTLRLCVYFRHRGENWGFIACHGNHFYQKCFTEKCEETIKTTKDAKTMETYSI